MLPQIGNFMCNYNVLKYFHLLANFSSHTEIFLFFLDFMESISRDMVKTTEGLLNSRKPHL